MITESELQKRIGQCNTKADFERVIYDGANGRLSRKECTMVVSKMFKLAEAEAEQEKAMVRDLWGAVAGWAKTLCGKA